MPGAAQRRQRQDKDRERPEAQREIDARRINLTVADGKVTLTGNVHSWFERDEARPAAGAAPGVKNVDDRIAVIPSRVTD